MSTDLTTLAVALVGVGGTMGAPWLTQRARRGEVRDQAELEERAREASRRDQLFEDKRALYARLNSVARAYRSALRNCALAVRYGEPSDEAFAALSRARAAYREQFDQAEMILPQRPFNVAVVVNEHLGYSYKLVIGRFATTDAMQDADHLLAWTRGPLVVAVELLRLALREDLGVIGPVTDLEAQLAALPIRRPRSRRMVQPLEAPIEVPLTRGLTTHGKGSMLAGREEPDFSRRVEEGPTATETATDEGE